MVFAKKAKRFELMTAGDDHWADILTPSILVFSLSGFEQGRLVYTYLLSHQKTDLR